MMVKNVSFDPKEVSFLGLTAVMQSAQSVSDPIRQFRRLHCRADCKRLHRIAMMMNWN